MRKGGSALKYGGGGEERRGREGNKRREGRDICVLDLIFYDESRKKYDREQYVG